MQVLKGVGLGLLFWIGGTIGFVVLGIVIGIIRGPVASGSAHATALSAVFGGLMEGTVSNPLYWLVVLLAFGLAFWLTAKSRRAT
jgi:hypothetical protein